MNKIKLWRLERGLSQVELALSSGIPRYRIQLSENGLLMLSNDELLALGRTLGVQAKELVSKDTLVSSNEASEV